MWIMTSTGWKMMGPQTYVEAQRNGIYRPDLCCMAQIETALRVEEYALNVQAYIGDGIGLEEIYHCWAKPLSGAFGEIIR